MKTKHQKFIEEKICEVSRSKIVLDIGGGARFQKWLAPHRELLKNCDYRTMDVDSSTGADVVGDIQAIPLPDEAVDAIICHSVLEHVENPLQATQELHRILKTGGKLFLYVPSIYPYHARRGSYGDYWRFFDDTLEILFCDFSSTQVVKRGGYFTALFFFVPLQHKIRFILDPLAGFLDKVLRTERRTTTAGYYLYAIK